jgi:hypothetical protein
MCTCFAQGQLGLLIHTYGIKEGLISEKEGLISRCNIEREG